MFSCKSAKIYDTIRIEIWLKDWEEPNGMSIGKRETYKNGGISACEMSSY